MPWPWDDLVLESNLMYIRCSKPRDCPGGTWGSVDMWLLECWWGGGSGGCCSPGTGNGAGGLLPGVWNKWA